MRRILELSGILYLVLLLSATTGAGQDNQSKISGAGSGIVNGLLGTLAADAHLELSTVGTAAGIQRFCAGDGDLATATRVISAGEDKACIENEVAYSEFLIAHRILAFAAHSSAPIQCLSRTQLEEIFKPSAGGTAFDWQTYDSEIDPLPATLLLPEPGSLDYLILDEIVAGDQLRADADSYTDAAQALQRVGETPGALAALPSSAMASDGQDLVWLDYQWQAGADCLGMTAENVEAGSYDPAVSLYVYVNRASLDANAALMDLTRGLVDGSANDAMAAAGFTPPSDALSALNIEILSDPERAAAIGDGEADFVIPPNLSGTVTVSGAANAWQLLDRLAANVMTGRDMLQINIRATGSRAGIASFCAGEAHIAMLDRAADQAELAACDENDMAIAPLAIGAQAVVMLSHSADDFAGCLTLEQIDRLWSASAAESVSSWSDVDAAFPDIWITHFASTLVDRYADLLLSGLGDNARPIRRDSENNFDPLYRAAAVGNVAGGITYMSWRDYQRVLDNSQGNVQLVAVDAGAGCIRPSAESIADGSYRLQRQANLLASESALADINVQSLLWTLYADDSYATYQREGFVGIEANQLGSLRRALARQFRLAEANQNAAGAEAETDASG